MKTEEPCDNCNNDVCCCIIKEEPKQETIEEVAERIYPIIPNSHPNINWDIINKREGFTEGYKLAQQQNKNLYSEEDIQQLRQLFKDRFDCYADSDDVVMAVTENTFIKIILEFEQFKKK